MTNILTFGSREPGATYRLRPGSYAIVRDEAGRVGVILTAVGNFLPGGGQEPGESAEATVRRECREECGFDVRVLERLGMADEFFHFAPDDTYWQKRGTFFIVAVLPGPRGPADAGHQLVWLPPHEAIATLTHESHRWAVQRAVDIVPQDRARPAD